jgi:MFS family permease
MPVSDGGERAPVSPDLLVFALSLSSVLYGLLVSMLGPALPRMAAELHAGPGQANWILIGFLLSSAVATPIVGRLGDVLGKKKVMVGVLGVAAVGLVVSGVGTSLIVVVIGRILQGILGGALPLAFGMARDELPPEKVAGGIGLISGFLGVGTGAGLVVTGPIVDTSYHLLFWIPLGVLLAAGFAIVGTVPNFRPRAAPGINWVGAGLMSGWLVTLLLAVSQAPEWGWNDIKVIALLVATPVLFTGWLYSEGRSSRPLLDLRMMRIPAVWTTNVVSFLLGNGLFAVAIILPQYAETDPSRGFGFGSSTTTAGYYMLGLPIGTLLFSVLSGRLTEWFGSKVLLIVSTVFVTGGYDILAFAHDDRWSLWATSTSIGIGSGVGFSAMASLVVTAVPEHQTGIAAGMNGNVRIIGQVLGSGLVTSVIASSATGGDPTERGYTIASLTCAVATLVAVVAAFAIPTQRGRDRRGRGIEPPVMSDAGLMVLADPDVGGPPHTPGR